MPNKKKPVPVKKVASKEPAWTPEPPAMPVENTESYRDFLSGPNGYGSSELFNERLTKARDYTEGLPKNRAVFRPKYIKEDEPVGPITQRIGRGLFEHLSDMNLDHTPGRVMHQTKGGVDFNYDQRRDEVNYDTGLTPQQRTDRVLNLRPENQLATAKNNGLVSSDQPTPEQVTKGIKDGLGFSVEQGMAHETGHGLQAPVWNGLGAVDFMMNRPGVTELDRDLPHEQQYAEVLNGAAILQRHLTKQGQGLDNRDKATEYFNSRLTPTDSQTFDSQLEGIPSEGQRLLKNLFRMRESKDPKFQYYLDSIIHTIPALVNHDDTALSIYG